MTFEKTMIYALDTPYSIYFKMVVYRTYTVFSFTKTMNTASLPAFYVSSGQYYLVSQRSYVQIVVGAEGHSRSPIQNPMSTVRMALLSIMVTVAHTGLSSYHHHSEVNLRFMVLCIGSCGCFQTLGAFFW